MNNQKLKELQEQYQAAKAALTAHRVQFGVIPNKGATPPKPDALIDMDGSVADFDTVMRADQLKLLAPGEEPRLSAEDEENYPYVKARRRLIKGQPEWWFNLPRLERGFRVVDMMRDLKFRLHVLTRGPKPLPNAWTEKVRWCQKHIPDAQISVTNAEKGQVYGRVLMDDWVPYVLPWLKRRPRGLVILPDQPWNQGFAHPQVVRHTDANDAEVYALLKAQRDRVVFDEDNEVLDSWKSKFVE